MTTNIFLGLGSNLGDREEYLRKALAEIKTVADIRKFSSLYESEPWGNLDQPPFLNLVIEIKTELSPIELLEKIKYIETRLGRQPREQWGPREIDIDILFYDRLLLKSPILQIPHPFWQQRPFVVIPLAEIAPDFLPPRSALGLQKLQEVIKGGHLVKKGRILS